MLRHESKQWLHPSIFVAGSANNNVTVLKRHSMVTISALTTNHEEEIDTPPAASPGKLEEKLPSAVPNVKSPSGPPEDIELVGHEGTRT